MMKQYFAAAAIVAALAGSSLSAQTRATSTMAIVVDTGQIFAKCTACVAAQATLKTQADAIKTREQQLTTQLQTEGQSIQTAGAALNGKEPDAALRARITAFQKSQQAAQAELAGREQSFNQNRAYVGQQIGAKLNPIITATMKARGANVAIDSQSVIAYEPALDVTADVMAQLNTQLPSVSTTAPAGAAPAKPAGR